MDVGVNEYGTKFAKLDAVTNTRKHTVVTRENGIDIQEIGMKIFRKLDKAGKSFVFIIRRSLKKSFYGTLGLLSNLSYVHR